MDFQAFINSGEWQEFEMLIRQADNSPSIAESGKDFPLPL